MNSTECCNSDGKVLGTVRITKAVKGKCSAELVCDNGEVVSFMSFSKLGNRWVNDHTPTHASNKQRLNVAVCYFYNSEDLKQFAADRSNYDSRLKRLQKFLEKQL